MKTARCKHLNGELIEVMEATHSRQVRNGNMETVGINEIGNITHYEFRCDDCGAHFKFGGSYNAPKWAANHIDNL